MLTSTAAPSARATPRLNAGRRTATRASASATRVVARATASARASAKSGHARLVPHRSSASVGRASAAAPSRRSSTIASASTPTAETVVRGMYDAINRRDVAAALEFVDDDILYEDFNFPTPFKGKAAVKKLFEESCDGIPDDMLFIIDECTDGGGKSVGMTWYVELEGEPFPNARGASLYRISETTGKLAYARDVVESPLKLGDVSFSIIRLVAPLVKEQLKKEKEKRAAGGGGGDATAATAAAESAAADAAAAAAATTTEANIPVAATLAAMGAAYWFVLLLSPPGWQGLPGEPAWAVAPETLNEVIAESTDFFFVLPLLNKFGVDLLGAAPQVHPVTLGVFNFAEAFIFMLLPPLLMDRKGRDIDTTKVWGGAMFLTNALMLPFMAQRFATPAPAAWERTKLTTTDGPVEVTKAEKGLLSKAFGASGLLVGVLSVWWALCADPEVGGDLAQRAAFLGELMTSDRVSLAFVVDIAFFSVWQAFLIGELDKDAPAACKFVPFWGLAAWLLL